MRTEMKKQVRDKVLQGFDYSEKISDEALLEEIDRVVSVEARTTFLPVEDREELRNSVYNSIRGLDILEELLCREDVTEIMVNGENDIFLESGGTLKKWDKAFESGNKLNDIIQQIVADANRVVNEASPIVDARLKDGSRVNVILPPVALNGPIVTIRKFAKEPFTMEKLIDLGAISEDAADSLRRFVTAGYNIFVCGGTGSGKTTFLNALSDFIPQDERIITIEDSAELKIKNIKNLVRLEVRNKNSKECTEVTIRDLIRAALRMRPDRIIVGEVRGPEVIDMLQAMNTGHDGSLSTGHGNSVPDMLDRLETMMLMGMDIPLAAVRKQVASAIDIMVHLGRMRDGSRKVLEISEVVGMNEGDIELNPLYVFKEDENIVENGDGIAVVGELKRTANPLVKRGKLKRAGIRWEDEA
ncbi:MAG: CpaF family protein [Lachnospiraceae bacterium]|nr:CpaF family protein [Lachnospiraceae bacterium]